MQSSINDVLLAIPLHELTFLTPFPKDEIYYEHVITSIPNTWPNQPTILIIETMEEWIKLNKKSTTIQLIQKSDLKAIIIYNKTVNPLQNEALALYLECQIPIIQVTNYDTIDSFLPDTTNNFTYNSLSHELNGFYQRGFIEVATNLSMAFHTPLLFLDQDQNPLWHTGSNHEINKFIRWAQNQVIEKKEGSHHIPPYQDEPCEQITLNIAGQTEISLIVSNQLALWQKKMMDKFSGFTAILFQTEEVVREQNDRFKEFFIYELLYRKFESKITLLKQGKVWGWNLEKPHHLLVLEIISPTTESFLLDEIVLHLDIEKQQVDETLIFLPFQEHIIILIEDEKGYLPDVGKNTSINIAHWIKKEIAKAFPDCSIQIGIGQWYHDTIDLNKCYQEAKVAIQFGKNWFDTKRVHHIHDLGVLHLLSNIHLDFLQTFCKEYLAPIIKNDEEQDTEYLKTFKAYFQHNGIIKDVSEALFIHPNTLRRRLNKAELIIGIDRQNLEQLLTLMIAIKIYYSFSL